MVKGLVAQKTLPSLDDCTVLESAIWPSSIILIFHRLNISYEPCNSIGVSDEQIL